jgi:hypothetical protein
MNEVRRELERIRIRYGGVLKPKDVVETARDPENVLHPRFEWDDEKAGEQYRLLQARQLIRVSVIVTGEEDTEPIKAYWSIK